MTVHKCLKTKKTNKQVSLTQNSIYYLCASKKSWISVHLPHPIVGIKSNAAHNQKMSRIYIVSLAKMISNQLLFWVQYLNTFLNL